MKEKLETAKVPVDIAQGRRDAFPKLLSLLPDVVLIDIEQDFPTVTDFLEKMRANPNTISLPVIAVGPAISPQKVVGLTRLGVTKYFSRPFMIDALVKAVSTLLASPVDFDTTPCIIDVHKNKSTIIIEVSLGLNLDKIAMLRFHLADMISNHDIANPRILLIFSNLGLHFVDGINLEKFFDSVTQVSRVVKKEIKVLTMDPFVGQFIEGHPEYEGIRVADNIGTVLSSLVEDAVSQSITELVETKLLSVDKHTLPCSTSMMFDVDIEMRKREISRNQQHGS